MVIRQYELNGKYINQFDTYDEAVEKTGIAKRQIQRNIYGEKKSGGGFIWERVPANTVCANIDPISYNDDKKKKPVYQFNIYGQLIAEFASISEAARLTGINVNGIRNVMNKRQKQAGGYLWLNNKEEDIFVNTECSPK